MFRVFLYGQAIAVFVSQTHYGRISDRSSVGLGVTTVPKYSKASGMAALSTYGSIISVYGHPLYYGLTVSILNIILSFSL